jgi:hypothetical protein
MDHSAFAGHIQLSAKPVTNSNPKYFRPKRLEGFVFPGIQMIMQPLYWVKYVYHLERIGIDPKAQSSLFLWTETPDGRRLADESVLYYSLLSEYAVRTGEIQNSVSIGIRMAKDWIFKNDFYTRLVEGLNEFISSKSEFNAREFADRVLCADFKTDCRVAGFDGRDVVAQSLTEISFDETTAEARFEAAAKGLVRGVKRCFDRTDLHRSGDENGIGGTLWFAMDIHPGHETPAVGKLADSVKGFTFSQAEAKALVELIQESDSGEFLLPSILLVVAADPLADHSVDRDRLWGIHEEILSNVDSVIDRAMRQLEPLGITSVSAPDLERISFYWALNYFLADGESIARRLIDDDAPIRRGEVNTVFERNGEKPTAFVAFCSRLERRTDWQRYLEDAIERLERNDSSDVASYLTTLLRLAREGRFPTDVFLSLLEEQGTVEELTSEQYTVTARVSDSDSAIFYGVNELVNWTKVLLESIDRA